MTVSPVDVPAPKKGGSGAPLDRLLALRLPRQPLLRHGILAILSGVALYLITDSVSPFNDFQVAQIGIYAIAVAGLTLLTGRNGQISLGHGAFMAVGAYATAELNIHAHVALVLQLLAGVGAAAVAGLLVGVVAARLRGPYLAGATLALALSLPEIAVKYSSALGGEEGLTLNPLTSPGTVNADLWLAWISLICALLVTVLLANLTTSRFGRAFRAVRDDEIAASLAGINVARTQVLAFVVSSACAGLAGSLLGLAVGNVGPQSFEVALSISLLAAMVIGGTGGLFGAWVGGLFLVYVPEWAASVSSTLHFSTAVRSNLSLAFYGLILMVVIIVAPGGIQGGLEALGRLAARAARRATTDGSPRRVPVPSTIHKKEE
ncbi:MAG: branched-chain amino acid ABC transporter permease [Acidimicrobiales bacterium]